MRNPNKLQLKQLSSLAKVFLDKINCPTKITDKKCVRGQEFSYQIAYRTTREVYEVIPYEVEIKADPGLKISVYRVENVPSTLPFFKGDNRSDNDFITKKPGLFPDPLIPLEDNKLGVRTDFWQSLWITVKVPESTQAGSYKISVGFKNEDGTLAAKKSFIVEVYPQVLPEARLLMGQWFYCDCIADIHNVEVFSEEHWALVEQYMRLAVDNGMNVIFTPVLTPPVNTLVGGERPTVQLVDITRTGKDEYTFDFSRLQRWIALALDCGFTYFEINHFFTQWGAAHAPKVIATVNGEKKRIFGWETVGTGEEYSNFLKQLIPAIINEFASVGIERKRLLFHVSDEPTPEKEKLEAYSAASALIQPMIKGCSQFDALSHYDFYENGSVWEPVVTNNNIQIFIDRGVPNLWVYYCCWQGNKVGNRLMAMPSYRNRILGVQMYRSGIRGFLHWGYNFYYTSMAERVCDPYKETDCGGAYVSGDAFSVYPYKNGATPALRMKVFYEALQDARLLMLVEEKIGKEAVNKALDDICIEMCGTSLSFIDYPHTDKIFDRISDFIFDNLK